MDLVCARVARRLLRAGLEDARRDDGIDSLTHWVVGMTLGTMAAAGAPDPTAAYWASVAGSMAPDIDVAVRWWGGDDAYLDHHRGITHAVPGLIGFSAALVPALAGGFGADPRPVALWFFVGWAVHVFMDCFNAYGTQALLPWSRRRVAWDVLFIFDVYILAILAAGLIAGRLGAEPWRAALAAFLAMWAYVGLRTWLRARALGILRRHAPQALRRAVFPPIASFSVWPYVLEREDGFELGRLDVARSRVEAARSLPSWRDDPVLRAAADHPEAAAFLRFARFPYARYEEPDAERGEDARGEARDAKRAGEGAGVGPGHGERGGMRHVVWSDLRLHFRGREVFRVDVWVDADGRPVSGTTRSPGRRRHRLESDAPPGEV